MGWLWYLIVSIPDLCTLTYFNLGSLIEQEICYLNSQERVNSVSLIVKMVSKWVTIIEDRINPGSSSQEMAILKVKKC